LFLIGKHYNIKPNVNHKVFAMKRQYFWYLFCLLFLCFFDSAFAAYPNATGPSVGDVAQNLIGPLTGIISMVRAICIIAGIGMVLSSFVKFGDHRRNRHEVTLALVITLFVAGACMIGLGFVPFRGM
jgi:type IV secretory pathway VirB2 component (pilin)